VGAVEIPCTLGVNFTLFEWYKQRFTRGEVSPVPGVTKGSNRKAIRQRLSGERSDRAMFVHQLRNAARLSHQPSPTTPWTILVHHQ